MRRTTRPGRLGGLMLAALLGASACALSDGVPPADAPRAASPAAGASSEPASTITDGTVTTEGGTGVQASMAGYAVCGKTGTAQKIDENGKYSKKKYIASFVGFVPAEHPEIAILVVVDEPADVSYGGIVAGPAFKKIAHETFNYLNVSPKGGGASKTAGHGACQRPRAGATVACRWLPQH